MRPLQTKGLEVWKREREKKKPCTLYNKKVETDLIAFFFFFTNIKFLVNMYSVLSYSIAGSISQTRHKRYTLSRAREAEFSGNEG